MSARISVSRSRMLSTHDLSRIGILGDIQNWTDYRWPEQGVPILQSQVNWVLNNRVSRKIEHWLCTGDAGNASSIVADYTLSYTHMSQLFVVPGMMALGNHDVDDSDGKWDIPCFNSVGSVTGYGMGDMIPLMTYVKDPGHLENAALLTTLSGRTALILSLEVGPHDAAIAWAQSILALHPGVFTILLTHVFLGADGTIFSGVIGANRNTGTDLVAKLVNPYPQIKVVVCGHFFSGHAHGSWTRSDGSKYHAFIVDLQQYDDGTVDWRGHMAELTVDFKNDSLILHYFSPRTNPVTEWPETLSSENPRYANAYIANAGIR